MAYFASWTRLGKVERKIELSQRRASERASRMKDATVLRYVITHLDKHGMRTLAQDAQGRYTYATAAEAQANIDAMMADNNQRTLAQLYGLPLEVRACPCWPGHHDPKSIYFDEAPSAAAVNAAFRRIIAGG